MRASSAGTCKASPQARPHCCRLPSRQPLRRRAPGTRQWLPTQESCHETAQRTPQPHAAAAAGAQPQDDSPAWIKKIIGTSEYSDKFRLRRWLLFSGLVLGYSFYYLCRNSLNYVLPVMVNDKSLGLSITQLATTTSIFPLAYGSSKFISGVLGAKVSPSLLLATGLMATAAVNVLFGFSSNLVLFCVLWAINGILQGFGGPACARMLTTWFASKERGTYWGLWNIAHNLGGFLAPIVAGTAAGMFGWRYGLFVPGIAGFAMGLFALFATGDSPEKEGYAPVEVIEKKKKDGEEEEDTGPSMMHILLNNVLRNVWIWGMALTYFFIYVIRQGVTSWSIFFLMNQKGVPDAGTAGFMVSGLEVGGLAGSLLAGRLADWLVNRSPDKIRDGAVGKRVQVVMLYTIGIIACLTALRFSAVGAKWTQAALMTALGFFIYGPQMLIGLCGAELVGAESVGASEGFLGWIAYLGAANAGVPLSIVVKDMGWTSFFNVLTGAAVIAFCIMAPMFRLQSHVQREKEKMLEEGDGSGNNTTGKPLDEPPYPAPAT